MPGRGACLVEPGGGGGTGLAFFEPALPGGESAAGPASTAEARVFCPLPGARPVGSTPQGPLLLSADGRLAAWGWRAGARWTWSPPQGRTQWAAAAPDGGALALVTGGSGLVPDRLYALASDGLELWCLDFEGVTPVLGAAASGGRAAVAVLQATAEGLAAELCFVGTGGGWCGRSAWGPAPPHLLGFGPDSRLLAVSEDRWRLYSWPARLEREGPAAGLAAAAAAGPEGQAAVAAEVGGGARLFAAGPEGGLRPRDPRAAGPPLALGYWGDNLVVAGRDGLTVLSPRWRPLMEVRFGTRAVGASVAGDLVLVDLGGGRMDLFQLAPAGGDRR
ncbi:MAG: hypothetical protein K6T75_09515 [Acetobacteraceae bacterium]|nr:hypothetical protein [Acetobacteraceae bacterium]